MWHAVKPETYIISQWAGGTTTQMAIWPPTATYASRRFAYRISRASVEVESSSFTVLPGVQRFLAITEGRLDLKHHEGNWIRLMPYEVHGFDGGDQTQAVGCVKDFNLMLSNGATGEMLSIILGEGEVYETNCTEANQHTWLYVAEGQVEGGSSGDFYKIETDNLRVCALSQAVLIVCRIDLSTYKE